MKDAWVRGTVPAQHATGDKVPLTFVIEDARGRRSTVEASAVVRPLGQ